MLFISLPQKMIANEATARKGPNLTGSESSLPVIDNKQTTTRQDMELIIIIAGTEAMPNQAPSIASILKSPYPIPSFRVKSLNA